MKRIAKFSTIACAAAVIGLAAHAEARGGFGDLAIKPSVKDQKEAVQGTAKVVEALPERAWGHYDPVAARASVEATYGNLVRDYRSLGIGDGINVRLDDTQTDALNDNDCRTCGDVEVSSKRVRVGVNASTNANVDFSAASTRSISPGSVNGFAKGALRQLQDGSFAWTTVVRGQDATALRLHFTDFNLPGNSELYIYNREGEVFGPYTDRGPQGTGDFWTNTIFGDELYVEVRNPGNHRALASTRFNIADVGVMGENFVPARLSGAGSSDGARSFCSYNAGCVQDASCYSTGAFSHINDLKDAVAVMLYSQGPYQYTCTGGLINDSDSSTQTPYFLTANHCISRNNVASSLESYFRFQTDSCGASCETEAFYWERTLGSSVASTNSSSDYTLLVLDQPAPSFAVFLGWTTDPIANSNGANLYRVSHPSTAPQAWSTHEVDTSAYVCSSWPRGQWIYSRDTVGATEGGSSGSPVVNSSGQIVGQLSGGCGFNLNDVCDSQNNATVDGAFAAYYNEISSFLGNDGGGGDPGGDTTPPAAPSGLSASAGDGSVSLDWANNGESDLDGYNVYRSTSSGGGYSQIASGLGSSSYNDSSVSNGTTYYYVVTAEDTSGNESANSGEASATPESSGSGGDPTSVSVSSITGYTNNQGRGQKSAVAVITVLDDQGGAVSGASVSVTFSGSISESVSGTTGGNGSVTLETSGTAKGGVTGTICVDSVSAGLPYDAGSNVESCDVY